MKTNLERVKGLRTVFCITEVVRLGDLTSVSTLSRTFSSRFGGQCKVTTAIYCRDTLHREGNMFLKLDSERTKRWQGDLRSVFRPFLCGLIKPDVAKLGKWLSMYFARIYVNCTTEWLVYLRKGAENHVSGHSLHVFSQTPLRISLILGQMLV